MEKTMLPRPDPQHIDTIKYAANLLTGSIRRAFQAQVVLDYCQDNTSHAKTLFGCGQTTLRKALAERESGTTIPEEGIHKLKVRKVDESWKKLGELGDGFTPKECRNYFKYTGYQNINTS